MAKRLMQSVLSLFGLRLTRLQSNVPPPYGLESFFPLLKQYGFHPLHVLDIGANHGNWTRAAAKYFPKAHYTLVEPQDNLRIYVQDLIDSGIDVQWINAGASDHSGVLTLYVDRRDECSTFMEVPRTVDAAVRRVDVPVKTVNEIVAASPFPVPDMVKIDAEGFDLRVINGASDLFGKTDVVLAEVSFGQRDFDTTALAVIQKMADAGYRFIDITDLNRSPTFGVLWLCEFAFLRNSSPLLDAATRY